MDNPVKAALSFRAHRFWLIVLSVLLTGSAAFNVYQSRQISLLEDPKAASEQQLAKYIREVGSVIALPVDETPTLAIVSDPEALKSQPFFAGAKAGDVVLVYEKAKKAVLWRPSEKKLIEVSSVIAGGASAASGR